MAETDTIENEEQHAQNLRQAVATDKARSGIAGAQTTVDKGSLEENKAGWRSALMTMFGFDLAGDFFGSIPFIGGIVRLITGIGAIIQSFKLNPAVRVRAWIINGITALIDMLLSFVGLNFLPTQTIGAGIITIMSGNAEQKEQLEMEQTA